MEYHTFYGGANMQDLRIPSDYEGQLSIFDYFEEPKESNPLIAVSKIFAAAKKQMSLAEWKTFVFALTKIKWKGENNNNQGKNNVIVPNVEGQQLINKAVVLNKKEVAEKIGLVADEAHLSINLRRTIGDLWKHSELKFENNKEWANGTFITNVICNQKNQVIIVFNGMYLPLFQELDKEKNYITMWADDLFSMNTDRSIIFYEELRLHSDTSKENSKIYGVKELKDLFNIPKEAYLRKDNHFDRTAFEKRIIEPLCEDMKKCSMINLSMNEDGKLYKKIKSKGKVLGYEFQWVISTHPRVATAKEVKEMNQNPETMKVANDILKGKKKPTKKKAKNNFNNFQQNEYDFEKLEEQLLDN